MYILKKVTQTSLAFSICIGIFLHSEIYAQSKTTIIGGGGLPELEVNMESIYSNNYKFHKNLKYPGQKINEKVRLVWPKNLGEIKNWEPKKIDKQEKIITAPVQKVYKKKLIVKKLPNKITSTNDNSASNTREQSLKIIKKNPVKSSRIINIQKNNDSVPDDNIINSDSQKIKNKKITSLKSGSVTSKNINFLRIIFKPSQTKIDSKYNREISRFALREAKKNSRFEIRAYASTSGNRPTYARRVSLSRALAIRTELIENGVNSSNIDVRALGEPQDGDILDRVDVSIMPQ